MGTSDELGNSHRDRDVDGCRAFARKSGRGNSVNVVFAANGGVGNDVAVLSPHVLGSWGRL
jgi:hypothetical protein